MFKVMNTKWAVSCLICVILILSISLIRTAVTGAEETNYEVLVKYRENKRINNTGPFKKSGLSPAGTEGIRKLGVQKVKFSSRKEMGKFLEEHKHDTAVEYIEQNIKYRKMKVPNDVFHQDDWALKLIRAENAWEVTTGSHEIVVAVVDTGVDLDHPDLINNIITGFNFLNPLLLPQDDDGHGTSIAGIIAAEGNNNIGKAGVVWQCGIMPLKVLDEQGEGYISDIADAIIYAADNGADIINLSLGGDEISETIRNAVEYAYGQGVVLVAASGNSNRSVIYPAAYSEVIAVGAVDRNGIRASVSNYGPELSVVAPGVNVMCTQMDGDMEISSGTSFATAYVSGAAALVLSYNPELMNSEVRQILENTARDLGYQGHDEYYGYGSIDLCGMMCEIDSSTGMVNVINTEIEWQDDLRGMRVIVYDQSMMEVIGEYDVDDTSKTVFYTGLDDNTLYKFIGTAPKCLSKMVEIKLSEVTGLNFGTFFKGELDGNDRIDYQDFQVFKGAYKTNDTGDFNVDGLTNFKDFQIFVDNYGKEGPLYTK